MVAPLHVYHPLAKAICARLEKQFPGRRIVACATTDALESQIEKAEVLLSGILPKPLLARAARLRWIQYMGAGVDSLLPAPTLRDDVKLTCTRGLFAAQVAEHAVGLLLSLHRGFASHHHSQTERAWRPFASTPLAGKTLAVLGLGEIGSRVARIAAAMDMTVIGVSRSGRKNPELEVVSQVFAREQLHAVLGEANAVVLTLPLTAETRHIIGEAELAAVPASSLLVNIGRGPLIDERALLSSLKCGHLGGAALDVFELEPLPSDNPLWSAPNTIITPHCSGTSAGHLQTIGEFFAENVGRFDNDKPLLNQVDRKLGY